MPLWNVCILKLAAKLRYAGVERELLRRELLQSSKRFRVVQELLKWFRLFWHSSFVLAFVINMLLIFGLAEAGGQTPTNKVIFGLGISQSIMALLVVLSYFLRKAPYLNATKWMRRLPSYRSYAMESFETIRQGPLQSSYGRFKPIYYVISAWHVFWDPLSLFYMMYLLFSLLGNIYDPTFFAFHLFQIVLRSSHLQLVFRALMKHWDSLVLMLLLMLDFAYIYAIIAFYFFSDFYVREMGSSCETLLQCLFTHLFVSVPSGGSLNEFVIPPTADPWDNSMDLQNWLWVLFNLMLFFTIGPICLNIVLATIVDSFSGTSDFLPI